MPRGSECPPSPPPAQTAHTLDFPSWLQPRKGALSPPERDAEARPGTAPPPFLAGPPGRLPWPHCNRRTFSLRLTLLTASLGPRLREGSAEPALQAGGPAPAAAPLLPPARIPGNWRCQSHCRLGWEPGLVLSLLPAGEQKAALAALVLPRLLPVWGKAQWQAPGSCPLPSDGSAFGTSTAN